MRKNLTSEDHSTPPMKKLFDIMSKPLFSEPGPDVAAPSKTLLGTQFESFANTLKPKTHAGPLLGALPNVAPEIHPEEFQIGLTIFAINWTACPWSLAIIPDHSRSLQERVYNSAQDSVKKLELA